MYATQNNSGTGGGIRAPEGRFPIGGKSPLKERAVGFAKIGPKRPFLGGGTLLYRYFRIFSDLKIEQQSFQYMCGGKIQKKKHWLQFGLILHHLFCWFLLAKLWSYTNMINPSMMSSNFLFWHAKSFCNGFLKILSQINRVNCIKKCSKILLKKVFMEDFRSWFNHIWIKFKVSL